MINVELVGVYATDTPDIVLRVCTRQRGEAMVPGGRSHGFYLAPIPSCRCCGEAAWPNQRCTKHQGKTPCVVNGCKRTTGRRTALFICGEHWKAYVPPGSPERRVLNRLVRTARRLGYTKTDQWPDGLERRWWTAWSAIARRVEARSSEGRLDEAEIRAMFGWGDE